uniref:uncharacterized protein LOC120326110 isoform X2 n=1 Tax=Styela clava TaxID=7725 RepID=UPI001939ED0C|nr:uncharacterized protein LOC120326110 isoform X2 [Styela clava]
MEEYSREAFCHKVSDELVRYIANEFEKTILLNVCLVQRTKHASKKRQSGFILSSKIVDLLHGFTSFSERFHTVLEDGLKFIKNESEKWSISISSWWKEGDSYRIQLDKVKAFTCILPKIVDFEILPIRHEFGLESNSTLLFCHVEQKLTINDIRSLLYCSFVRKALKCDQSLIHFSCDDETCCDVIKNLDLGLMCNNSYKDYAADITKNTTVSDVPQRFLDCILSEEKDSFPCLSSLRNQENKTAFESRIANTHKNAIFNTVRQNAKTCFHVCNQKNEMSARQAELHHAWSSDVSKKSAQTICSDSDKYFVHAGVNETRKAIDFIRMRKKQIIDAFETKLQISVKGKDWENRVDKMTAATIRLEFLKSSPTNRLKISTERATLPTDVMFMLYNFSRLNMLLNTFTTKVKEGYYPPLPSFSELQLASLVEDAEWELFIDHLWMFFDVISKPVITVGRNVIKISCHNVIDYLQQLCRSVSTFYSRHHILGQNLPHLLPALHARIYLIKATRNAMLQILNLLGIEPPQQM